MSKHPWDMFNEDRALEKAIDEAHNYIREGWAPKTWKKYLEFLNEKLDLYLGKVDK